MWLSYSSAFEECKRAAVNAAIVPPKEKPATYSAEAGAADQSDFPLARRLVAGEEMLQGGDFARDIQVIGSGSQAGRNERWSGGNEWPGRVEHCIDLGYRPLKLIWLIKAEGLPGKAEAFSQGGERCGRAAG